MGKLNVNIGYIGATVMAFDRSARYDKLAFDRASVRRFDDDGRLHVELANISKANVCGYFGREIPDYEALGLDPDRMYQLLRDPEELAKAANTFNNVPLLRKHVAINVEDPKQNEVIGSTGTDAVFQAPYLKNSLVVWTKNAVEGVETNEAREISCGYRYRADMTPGTYHGEHFDGVMRDISANHVALVPVGRAGPDVVIGDSKPLEKKPMSKKPLSAKATLARGALLAALKPKLAQDAMPDLSAILQGVTAKNWHAKKPAIVAAIKPQLAQDADVEGLVNLLDSLDGEETTELEVKKEVELPAQDSAEEILNMLRGKISDEDLAMIAEKLRAKAEPVVGDNPPPTEGTNAPGGYPAKKEEKEESVETITKQAMDSAIQKAVQETEKRTIARLNAISEAHEVVKPFVGKLAIAADSAEDVYKSALKHMEVDVDGVHPSAYRAILVNMPKPGQATTKTIAVDAAVKKDADHAEALKQFPDLYRI